MKSYRAVLAIARVLTPSHDLGIYFPMRWLQFVRNVHRSQLLVFLIEHIINLKALEHTLFVAVNLLPTNGE